MTTSESRWTARTGRILVILVAAFAALLGPAAPASAHAVLASSTPPADTVLDTAPERVVLTFTESVREVPGKIRVIGPDGNRIDKGDPTFDGATVTIPVDPSGPRGTYLVSYRVISADSHPVAGGYSYSVGAPSAKPTVPAEDGGADSDRVVAVAVSVAKYLGYAGLLLLFGGALVSLLLWPRRLSRAGPNRVVAAGAGLITVATLAGLWLQVPYTTGGGLFQVGGSALVDVLSSNFGAVNLVRLAILGAALAVLRPFLRNWPAVPEPAATERVDESGGATDRVDASGVATADAAGPGVGTAGEAGAGVAGDLVPAAARVTGRGARVAGATEDDTSGEEVGRVAGSGTPSGGAPERVTPARPVPGNVLDTAGRSDRILLALLAVGGLVTWPLSGHGAASPAPLVSVVADTVHLGSMAVWVGGLVMLAVFLLRRANSRELAAILPVWAGWAALSVSALVIAGAAQGLIEVQSFGALFFTTYGQLLIAKLVLFGSVILTAAYSRYLVNSGRAATEPRLLRRAVLVEIAMTATVLAISSTLVQTTPARTAEAQKAAPASSDFSTRLTSPLYTLEVTVEPARVGNNSVHLVALTPDGKPAKVVEWQASAGLPAQGVEPIDVPLLPLTDDHATGEINLPTGGDWQFRFTLRTSDIDQATVTATVPVR